MLKIKAIDSTVFKQDKTVVPDEPGVYALYRRLSVDEIDGSGFKESIENIVEAKISSIAILGNGLLVGPYEASVELSRASKPLTEAKRRILDRLSQSEESRIRFKDAMLAASTMQPPLKVGRSDDLRDRMGDYESGNTNFSKEAVKNNVRFTDLIISYVVLSKLPVETNNLVEFITTVAGQPRYNKKTG